MATIYQHVADRIHAVLGYSVSVPVLKRLSLLVVGLLKSKSCSPAQVAKALEVVGVGSAESLERQLRRIENDERLDQRVFHPLALWHLQRAGQSVLHLAVDPTTKCDKVVLLMISVLYRGRHLPLVWTTWPANTPLEGARFWERVAQLLDALSALVRPETTVVICADRAFGTPAFTDLVRAKGWHYLVRVQDQTRCKDRQGRVCAVRGIGRGQRAKMRGHVFKKQGWREATVVVYRRSGDKPMCLVSDLRPRWELLRWYQYRAVIETLFRDYKSHGWHWEQSQVIDLGHLERLLVGQAWATWITIGLGRLVADQWLCDAPTGRRRTRPWWAKDSLFALGQQQIEMLFFHEPLANAFERFIAAATQWWNDWTAPTWAQQVTNLIGRAYVLALP